MNVQRETMGAGLKEDSQPVWTRLEGLSVVAQRGGKVMVIRAQTSMNALWAFLGVIKFASTNQEVITATVR